MCVEHCEDGELLERLRNQIRVIQRKVEHHMLGEFKQTMADGLFVMRFTFLVVVRHVEQPGPG